MSLTRKPRRGEKVVFPDNPDEVWTVTDYDGNLCWMRNSVGEWSSFIAAFDDGTFNTQATIVNTEACEKR